jgi:nucleoid DNA-binding protein
VRFFKLKMKKSDLVVIISKVSNISINRADFALNALLESIIEKLAAGEKVNLTELGTFSISERSERLGRNPKTGKELTIDACKTVRFSASKTLKKEINLN